MSDIIDRGTRAAPIVSAADREAAAALLGLVWLGEDTPKAKLTFRSWDVPGSGGKVWHVTEREDTKHGGTYVYCPCPAWKYNGLSCKHSERVALPEFANVR